MRVVYLGLLAATLMSSTSVAADLIVEDVVYDAAMEAAGSWTGLYVGIQAGFGSGQGAIDDEPESAGTSFDPFDPEWDMSGAIGGVYAGFNWQADSLVLGVEGDLNLAGIEGSSTVFSEELDGTIDWLGSLRARVGVAFDSTLLYGTAGLAVAGGSTGQNDSSGDATLSGWVAGAGVEQAFTDQISGRLEYRYYSLAASDVELADSYTTRDYDVGLHTVMAGVSFKF